MSPIIPARRDGPPRTRVMQSGWRVQTRLFNKFKRLSARRLLKTKAVVALARKLAKFVWAIGRG